MEGEHTTPDRGISRIVEAGGRSAALVRYAHIFSAAVRETLEERLLQEVSGNTLRISEFHLLRFLALCDTPPQIHDVARFLGVTPPAATRRVDRLERLALVRRGPCDGDRRVTLLELTAGGRELVTRHQRTEHERMSSFCATLTPEEIALLARLLERLAMAMIDDVLPARRLCLRCATYFDVDCPVQFFPPGCPYQRDVSNQQAESH